MLAQRGPFRRSPVGGPLASYTLPDGTAPVVVLDFVNSIYYDGTATPSTLGALVNGSPTVDAGGLIMPGNNTLTAKGAFLSAFNSATPSVGVTVAVVTDRGGLSRGQFPVTMGTDNNTFMYYEGSVDIAHADCYAPFSSVHLVFAPCNFTGPVFYASGYATSAPVRSAIINDQTAQQDANAYDQVTPVVLGDLNAGSSGVNSFNGRIRRIAIYPKRLTAAQLPQLRTLAPWSVAKRTGFYFNKTGTVGSATLNNAAALKIERTQPWTAVVNFAVGQPATTAGAILFANVTGAPFCGYEIWVTGTSDGGTGRPFARVCVRVMQDILGTSGPASAIDVYSSTGVGDGNAHMIACSYDGSSTAAGVSIYIDGVLDGSPVVIQNNLAGSILGNAGAMWVGNQQGTGFAGAMIDFLALSNIVRSAGYMAACSGYNNKPALDANNTLYYDFTEGSGTTLNDKSSNGFNATLTGGTWY